MMTNAKDTIFRGVFNLLSISHNYSYAKLYLTFYYCCDRIEIKKLKGDNDDKKS